MADRGTVMYWPRWAATAKPFNHTVTAQPRSGSHSISSALADANRVSTSILQHSGHGWRYAVLRNGAPPGGRGARGQSGYDLARPSQRATLVYHDRGRHNG